MQNLLDVSNVCNQMIDMNMHCDIINQTHCVIIIFALSIELLKIKSESMQPCI